MVTCLILGSDLYPEYLAIKLRACGPKGWIYETIPSNESKVDVILQLGDGDPDYNAPIVRWEPQDLKIDELIYRLENATSRPKPKNIYPYVILFLGIIVILGRIASC